MTTSKRYDQSKRDGGAAFRHLPIYRLGRNIAAPLLGPGVDVRIGEDARKCVVFFGIDGEHDRIDYGGTGFLAVYNDNNVNVPYLITCRHVAMLLERLDKFYIRANNIGIGSTSLPIENIEWAYHPDKTVDLAAASFVLQKHTFDAWYYTLNDETVIVGKREHEVATGDVINIVGLFRLHSGSQRNVPFIHTGNIAVLPDANERVPIRDRLTGEIVRAEVYLVEAQTLDGLSGSPVFMHGVVSLPLKLASDPLNEHYAQAFGLVRMLGLYSSSWDGEPGKILAADRDLRGNMRVPVGVGTVVPAIKIIELIKDHPTLKKERKNFIQARLAQHSASQDAAIPDPRTSGENPDHREDFTSLLAAAVKKNEPKD